ncbi:Protein of unknown function [Pyronema omphalodes CBS 100304]|uniref:Uncharacterized protein n=1 Tax=Pyronema omphalodes (strain CBS 100304) TaxID=1076935 RepID=U4LHB9_PYROM|nr:Protein of unknown function [Pyronema omphalodes CBS 100304]
MQVPRQRCLQ